MQQLSGSAAHKQTDKQADRQTNRMTTITLLRVKVGAIWVTPIDIICTIVYA